MARRATPGDPRREPACTLQRRRFLQQGAGTVAVTGMVASSPLAWGWVAGASSALARTQLGRRLRRTVYRVRLVSCATYARDCEVWIEGNGLRDAEEDHLVTIGDEVELQVDDVQPVAAGTKRLVCRVGPVAATAAPEFLRVKLGAGTKLSPQGSYTGAGTTSSDEQFSQSFFGDFDTEMGLDGPLLAPDSTGSGRTYQGDSSSDSAVTLGVEPWILSDLLGGLDLELYTFAVLRGHIGVPSTEVVLSVKTVVTYHKSPAWTDLIVIEHARHWIDNLIAKTSWPLGFAPTTQVWTAPARLAFVAPAAVIGGGGGGIVSDSPL